jgi:glycosyltransferase involved in cell wall biosynthesis
MQPQLSVVVPTYNRALLLRRTLESLAGQRNPPPFEVIVADDGSSDDTMQVTTEFHGRLTIKYCYQEDEGYQVAKARNMGAAIAEAPILVFLDGGTLAGPDLLASHLRCHTHQPIDQGSSAHGPAVAGYAYGYQPYGSTAEIPEASSLLNPEQMYERYHDDPLFRDPRHENLASFDFQLNASKIPWRFFWTMNVSINVGDYQAIGGFDERFRSWGCEDVELGYRLHQRGVPFVFDLRSWAIEIPQPRDRDTRAASNKSNVLQTLAKHADPAIELYWGWLTLKDHDNAVLVEDDYRALLGWAHQARGIDVQPEVDRGTADLPAGARVAILGSGASAPRPELNGLRVDFDRELLSSSADSRFATRHGVGLHVPVPDHAFDRVVITSRLSGAWPQWGDEIRAEATRIGTSVHSALP